jgi:hypothetical protein
VCNIEAGRQHAPLHVLWRIAEATGTELALLLPRREEVASEGEPLKLDASAVEQIEEAANGDPVTKHLLTQFVTRAKGRSRGRRDEV